MSKKNNEPIGETLTFEPEDLIIFMTAISNVSKKTLISNNSIDKIDDRTLFVRDTKASYLLNVGMEYQRLQMAIVNNSEKK